MSSFKPAEPIKIENYEPQKVESPPSVHAIAFSNPKNHAPNDFFELNPEISHFIGLTEAKSKEEKRKFDAEVFKFVQQIKDNAYQEAYDRGLQMGIEEAKKEAFIQARQDIQIRLQTFAELCDKIQNMSKKIFEQNEKDVIEFSYLMAEKIVNKTLQREKDLFINTINEVLKNQSATKIELSEEDFHFFEEYKKTTQFTLDLSQIHIEINKDLRPGDVLFSNDLGIVDGTIQSRFEILKQVITGLEK